MVTTSREYTAKNLNKRNGAKIEFIVLHDTAGNGGLGDVKYLANDPERRGVSVEYVIPKDGTIYQLNPDPFTYCTNHAGRKTKFRGYLNHQVNRHSIGIEIGQRVNMRDLNPKYPEAQIFAVADLCSSLCSIHGLDKTDITTHSKIITDGSRSDPREFPWDQFWKFFNRGVGSGVHEDRKIEHVVVKGDTLYSLSVKYLTSIEKLKALNGMSTMNNNIKVGQKLIVKE